jgi:heme-degrading monooxygenase HmoA
MIVTVFRNRLRPEHDGAYSATAEQMNAAARAMPGYLSHKTFVAEDGERVTIVEFSDAASQRAWAEHAGHREAQAAGRRDFYRSYRIQVCEVLRQHEFSSES